MQQIEIEKIEVLLNEKIEELVNIKVDQKLRSLGILDGPLVFEKQWMNLQECANYIGVCVNTLKEYEKRGLKVFRNGRKVLISKQTIDNFLIKHSR